MDLFTKFGKEIPSRNLRKKRSVITASFGPPAPTEIYPLPKTYANNFRGSILRVMATSFKRKISSLNFVKEFRRFLELAKNRPQSAKIG